MRLEQMVNGNPEHHYFCSECAQEIMRGAMQAAGQQGPQGPNIFGIGGSPRRAASGQTQTATQETQSKTPALDHFGRDLTREAADGRLDPTAARDREIRRVITILSRRQKNNPVLIGEPGVGKTAIVEGIALKIANHDVPTLLEGRRVIALNMGSMVAGAMFRGQFEERVKAIVEEVKHNPEIILFIDELHTVVGTGAAEGAVGASDMLKPALARGDLHLIGATTLDEYRKHIEKDAALERRFQPVLVGEPSVDEAVQMLQAVVPQYEHHHNVTVTPEAVKAAVVLSDRYVSDRFLPDKAIDVIDEAAANLRIDASEAGEGPEGMAGLEKRIALIAADKEEAALHEDYERAAQLRQQELIVQMELDGARAEAGGAAGLEVGVDAVAKVIEVWTGVPVGEMLESERANLVNLESDLKQRVVGQDEAVSAVARAIRRSRAGLKDLHRPIGSFLFLGPTGVGKTELARTLAATVFGRRDAMIRLDMSEYREPHTVSRLFGSPPGYVGYDDAGQLTEQVRRRPFSVVLFDEIEKAHPEVFNALLQVLDDGRLTDGQGRTIDFKNTIIIMTSNVGSSDLKRGARIGFLTGDPSDTSGEAGHDEMSKRVLEALRRSFRPEFLNRVDQVVVFRSLDRASLRRIVDILLADVQTRLAEQAISLTISDAARDHLVATGYNEEYGARPLRRAIQGQIEDPLADRILNGEIASGDEAAVDMEGVAVSVLRKVPHAQAA
ncbi:MAG TPA: ATP-dependent Clp protease ATP-binding subunit [Chloroflexota bacterium]|nr:ATP-dependent Clp protease ATP-binding subunit [Chloroflexota bacterium]